jgi:hypothetical protein
MRKTRKEIKIFQLTKSEFFRFGQLPRKALKVDSEYANGSHEADH